MGFGVRSGRAEQKGETIVAQVRVGVIFPCVGAEGENCPLELWGTCSRGAPGARGCLWSPPRYRLDLLALSREVSALGLFGLFLSPCKLFSPQHQAEEGSAASVPLWEQAPSLQGALTLPPPRFTPSGCCSGGACEQQLPTGLLSLRTPLPCSRGSCARAEDALWRIAASRAGGVRVGGTWEAPVVPPAAVSRDVCS